MPTTDIDHRRDAGEVVGGKDGGGFLGREVAHRGLELRRRCGMIAQIVENRLAVDMFDITGGRSRHSARGGRRPATTTPRP